MEENKSTVTKNKIVSSMMWLFGERISAQLVSTLVTIILARLLSPEHYGMISIVAVFITFSNVFVTGGFSTAMIQKKEADDLDFDTALMISMATACLLYTVLFFAAPYIAAFYEMPKLAAVVRTVSLVGLSTYSVAF